ncbi:heme biosynthesis HemY N-terminal domain-containing protein [Gilvimarinus sp. SDUM040013]|uniref:Heme biosynthesis HemY N-terminal domain-containing protein n=1 Tax=Gilvimarinus gilvus TaxID=3058038 RepID=A0ABU4S1H3_9GAMM|nr:heme biosynthesis HemY N-terminal domain-containing protein [Gilvimarinus sp. SDUM040013]MDO3384405.1 heme biosynthesis HemY N-terminal domain-containing protein [Gilvimarinus sp. SDUM040013]MDX6851010.1 heme biosynthesis HemY N-terminal domain-containing protein [Gilvimarinus sp. SDUM040013]
MKKRLILLLPSMVGGALLFQLMRSDRGYVLLSWGHTSVEMSIWTALGLWLLGFVIFYWGWRFFSGSRRFGRFVLGERKQTPRSQQKTFSALVKFIEGNWPLARKQLVKSASRSANPLVNYLAAARCAYEQGDFPGALDLLHKAEKSQPGSELAVALTQARMQLGSKRYEQCLATLKRIKRLAPEHPVVLDLLADVYWALDDIDALEELLPTLHRLSAKGSEGLIQLEVDVYLRQLKKLEVRRKKDGSDAVQKQELDAIWERVPNKLSQEPELMAAFAMALHRLGCDHEAEPLLHKALQKRWHSCWVERYGLVQADAAYQLKVATSWQKQHDADGAMMATLGRLCVRNQLWGKARDYFRQALEMKPGADVYLDYAALLERLGEPEQSADLCRQGLQYLAAQDSKVESAS